MPWLKDWLSSSEPAKQRLIPEFYLPSLGRLVPHLKKIVKAWTESLDVRWITVYEIQYTIFFNKVVISSRLNQGRATGYGRITHFYRIQVAPGQLRLP